MTCILCPVPASVYETPKYPPSETCSPCGRIDARLNEYCFAKMGSLVEEFNLSKTLLKVVGERFRWELRITVPPGKVSGEFPRSEGMYKDCAVFVKIGGEKPRLLRIPITGRADN